jgi:anti-anti-sigma regulatory factor
MGEVLKIDREVKGNVLILRLQGNITEDAQIEDLNRDLKPVVVVDLEKVARINSYGIRQWINVMKELNREAKQVVFHRCPPAFVEQFNMISNFGGGGIVYSFYLPFYSEAENKEALKLYSLPQGRSPDIPPRPEDLLGKEERGTFVFNDIEDEYFCFLQHQKGRSVLKEALDALT